MKLTQSNEDYLEAILMLSNNGNEPVRSVDIASHLGVSKPSVNRAIAVLRDQGFIEQESYGDIFITKSGIDYGHCVLERHETLTGFLVNMLGVDSDTAESEACMMEHAISDDTFTKWKSFIDSYGK